MGIIEQTLRDAIKRSGLTRYVIAKESGVSYEALMRFLDEGRDIRLSTVEKLAAFFEMELTAKKKPAITKTGNKRRRA